MPRTTARLPGSVGVGLEWVVGKERKPKEGREGKGGIDRGGVELEVSRISLMPLHIVQDDKNQRQNTEGKSAKNERNPQIRRKDKKRELEKKKRKKERTSK